MKTLVRFLFLVLIVGGFFYFVFKSNNKAIVHLREQVASDVKAKARVVVKEQLKKSGVSQPYIKLVDEVLR